MAIEKDINPTSVLNPEEKSSTAWPRKHEG